MIFAARRTAIDPNQWPLIQEHDGYRKLAAQEEPTPGDIVLYANHESTSHVALIHTVERSLATGTWALSVISKWGRDGEYIHDPDDIPEALGLREGIWTERLP